MFHQLLGITSHCREDKILFMSSSVISSKQLPVPDYSLETFSFMTQFDNLNRSDEGFKNDS